MEFSTQTGDFFMKKKKLSNRQTILWVAAGAYLLYLVYKMYSSGELGINSPIKIIIMIIFLIAGIFLIFGGLKSLR